MKKMILVDPRVLERPYLAPDTLTDNLQTLDHQMQQILENEDLPMREKASLYQQTLQRYMNRFAQYRQKPLGLVDMKPPPITDSRPVLKEESVDIGHQSTQPEESLKLVAKATDEPSGVPETPAVTPGYKLRRKKKSKIPTPRWEKWLHN